MASVVEESDSNSSFDGFESESVGSHSNNSEVSDIIVGQSEDTIGAIDSNDSERIASSPDFRTLDSTTVQLALRTDSSQLLVPQEGDCDHTSGSIVPGKNDSPILALDQEDWSRRVTTTGAESSDDSNSESLHLQLSPSIDSIVAGTETVGVSFCYDAPCSKPQELPPARPRKGTPTKDGQPDDDIARMSDFDEYYTEAWGPESNHASVQPVVECNLDHSTPDDNDT